MSLPGMVIVVAAVALLPITGVGKSPVPASTFEAVHAGRSCARSTAEPGTMECRYRVGASLEFTIAGVGLPDAGIAFDRSNKSGDYFAGFGLQHQCVIVWPGAAITGSAPARATDVAFVSPRDGKVYKDWAACAHPAR